MAIDYHDLKVFELEQAAENNLSQAALALKAGNVGAAREVERWSITLANIRHMKAALARMQRRELNADRGNVSLFKPRT